jgi:hypothetical protein
MRGREVAAVENAGERLGHLEIAQQLDERQIDLNI